MERHDDKTDELEERSERLGEHIEEARMDWESKEEDSQVPGAQPDPGEEEEPATGVQTDPELVDEEGGP